MKKILYKIAKEHGFTIENFVFVNNFDWKYYSMNAVDSEGQSLSEFDFEYCIYDEGYKEQISKDFVEYLTTGKNWQERLHESQVSQRTSTKD